MTYREMAEEYRQSAEQIEQKIKRLKAERKTASVPGQVSIDKRIWILYGMYFDCMNSYKMLIKKGMI